MCILSDVGESDPMGCPSEILDGEWCGCYWGWNHSPSEPNILLLWLKLSIWFQVHNINSSNKSQNLKKRPKPRNWQEQKTLKRQIKQVEEDEQTLANLESAIPQSNIGFKMLKQMGYTPGSGLGGSGRVEPVGVEIRRSRAGIGREDPVKEKLRKEEELAWENRRREEELMVDFGCRVKERWRNKRVVVNFHKAKGVLDQLENKEVVVVEKEDDADDDKEDEEEEVITEEVYRYVYIVNYRFVNCC